VIGALAVVASLAACSGGQPGAAAVVGDRVVRVSDVDTATRELTDVLQGVTAPAVVGVLVQEPVVVDEAADAGLGVSQEQARDALAQQAEQAGVSGDRTFSAPSVAVMRYVLAFGALQQSADEARLTGLKDRLTALDVTVSPRYGSVDALGTPETYPWLVPTATSTATPDSP
jgi:hypothetical protein